ncbi:TonB family protein [Cognaticolwellia mytili]|uniref:TonB family protein n=1 Tax=Cognaticolwellia mytili TaxID=1888913 RepID=UPI000A1767FC|nr:TonB family protein [Cognaticolwellia mytili]
MSADKFDKELSEPCQKSKQQAEAPIVDLISPTEPINTSRSLWHMLALLIIGGAASFCIMAIITYFSEPAVHGVSEQYKQHSVRVVKIDEIKPEVIVLLPTHKVMPEYPKSALYSRKSGKVKLQYRISYSGKVIDVSGMNRHSDRALELSAKKALSLWRYPEAAGGDKFLEIEFEFTLEQ